MILFEGLVIKIEADNTGWGESLRQVGVAVTLRTSRSDEIGQFDKETTIHLPLYVDQPNIGDKLVVSVTKGPWAESREDDDSMTEVPDEARDEIARLVAEEADEVEDRHVDTEFEERTEL